MYLIPKEPLFIPKVDIHDLDPTWQLRLELRKVTLLKTGWGRAQCTNTWDLQ